MFIFQNKSSCPYSRDLIQSIKSKGKNKKFILCLFLYNILFVRRDYILFKSLHEKTIHRNNNIIGVFLFLLFFFFKKIPLKNNPFV